MICPDCNEEYREGFMVCVDCGRKLINRHESPQEEPIKETPVFTESTFLCFVEVCINTDIFIAALKNNEIPVMVSEEAGSRRTLGHEQNIGGVLSTSDFQRAIQRWHFKFGLPSTTKRIEIFFDSYSQTDRIDMAVAQDLQSRSKNVCFKIS